MRRRRTRGAGFVLFLALSLVLTVMPAFAGDRQDVDRLQAQKDANRAAQTVATPVGADATAAGTTSDSSTVTAATEVAAQVEAPDGVPSDVAGAIEAQKAEGVRIVMLIDDPAATYEGGTRGMRPTAPADGEHLDTNSAEYRRYVSYLESEHDRLLAEAGIPKTNKVYSYTASFNGFAAEMTGAQAEALRGLTGVVAVWEDDLRSPTTDLSPTYLGMSGVWEGAGILGEDVIVGVVDTGIWPEHSSFSDQTDLGDRPGRRKGNADLAYGAVPAHWTGTCQSGENWSQDDCNNKLIGARYFVEGFGKQKALFSAEYLSARDFDGHGTHTASTAAGNAGVETPLGDISGMAPRARVAMYKACWNSDPGYCATSDLVAAIDAAVADGVDVINYSIGGGSTSLATADAISFLFAADAGVYVATSNGNSGPGVDTTGNPAGSPWVTSVAALAHRASGGEVTLGNAETYTGPSVADPGGTGPMPIVDAADHGNPLCYPEITFDPPITDHAVLCWRGDIARVAKSQAVAEQGGIGMVLANVDGGATSTNADVHSVPSIHVTADIGALIEEYVHTDPAPTVDIRGQLGNTGVTASFSSRGFGGSEDIIKPDIAAPGVAVLAAAPPYTYYGTTPDGNAQFLSGTSMASPHVAGIGALLAEAHPTWSPAMVKSALMTTANPAVTYASDGVTPASPIEVGSGLVQPTSALDPGLVYDAGFYDYVSFLCGAQPSAVSPAFCASLAGAGYDSEPSNLNQPNIAVGSLAGTQTVTRTVTNVGEAGTYDVVVDAPAGVAVEVDPSSLTLAEGESATYEVTLTTDGGAIGSWTFGSLTWSDGSHAVTSAIAARPVEIAAPTVVQGSGAPGSVLLTGVSLGIPGDYEAVPYGLAGPYTEASNVVDDPTNDYNTALGTCFASGGFDPADCVGITFHVVPATGPVARISLFDDAVDGADDLDLYVYDQAGGRYVGGSGSGTSAEQVDVIFPEGLLLIAVHGWETDGPDSNYTLFVWQPDTDNGDLSVDVVSPPGFGVAGEVEISWGAIDFGAYDHGPLGAVTHGVQGSDPVGATIVEISP